MLDLLILLSRGILNFNARLSGGPNFMYEQAYWSRAMVKVF
jgi:hypothetical protein